MRFLMKSVNLFFFNFQVQIEFQTRKHSQDVISVASVPMAAADMELCKKLQASRQTIFSFDMLIKDDHVVSRRLRPVVKLVLKGNIPTSRKFSGAFSSRHPFPLCYCMNEIALGEMPI